MAVANSYFQNSYTFTISGMPEAFQNYAAVIEANAVEAIEHISDYVSWNGVLDFVVKFGDPYQYGHNGTGLLPAYGGIASSGDTYALAEARTGVDANGADWDAGLNLLPNANGRLTNFSKPLYFDPNPDADARAAIPAGTHDFFSIFLHESLHSLGFWSTAQHGDSYRPSTFDRLTEERGGQHYFVGDNVRALLGEDLPLARPARGSRDHYGTAVSGDGPVTRGAVFETGNYEQNRWHLGKLDVAVLQDLGYAVGNTSRLPLVELDDQDAPRPPTGGGSQPGVYAGTEGAETIIPIAQSNTIDGAGGADVVRYDFSRSEATISLQPAGRIVVQKSNGYADTIDNVEKVRFSDGALLFDLASPNASAAYRLYGGAFDRVPDEGGLRYWTTKWLDQGRTLHDAAAGFIDSPEFAGKYGTNLSDAQFISQLYQNVLGRDGEAGGTAYWQDFLANATGDRADVLVSFTQLPEYTAMAAPDMDNGYWVG